MPNLNQNVVDEIGELHGVERLCFPPHGITRNFDFPVMTDVKELKFSTQNGCNIGDFVSKFSNVARIDL